MNLLPCRHGKLSQAHRRSQSTCPAFPQIPANKIEERACRPKGTQSARKILKAHRQLW